MQLNGRDERQRPAVAYIVPWYPAISHTFVLREVQALRRMGRHVATISIHRPSVEDMPAEADRQAYATTYFLSPPRVRDHVAAHWQALRTRPGAYVSTLVAALRAGPIEPAVKARGLLYFCEAVVVWWHARRSGARHLHGVFAGPAADAGNVGSVHSRSGVCNVPPANSCSMRSGAPTSMSRPAPSTSTSAACARR